MNRRLIQSTLRVLGPLDSAVRRLNGKSHLPPLHLRWDVGPLKDFEADAAECRVYLKLYAGLRPDSSVLDLGCGCGQMALELASHLGESGRYLGADINPGAIRWCNTHIAARDRRFRFVHLDLGNNLYRPGAAGQAAAFRFPEEWGTFRIVLIKSVFTHLMKNEVENYVSQLRGLMSPDGSCLATFFLLNERQRALEEQGRALIHFTMLDGDVACADPQQPERIVAFDERFVIGIFGRHGLVPALPVMHGTWTGDRSNLSHQDMIVFRGAAT